MSRWVAVHWCWRRIRLQAKRLQNGPKLACASLALVLAAVWIAGTLAFNPGYFSHDELQWGAFAAQPDWATIPWHNFLDLASYQYRPLTFNLWLVIARLLFEWPLAMHLFWLLLGAGNASLLYVLLRRSAIPPGPAGLGALLFLLSPYAVYVHGWVATLADLLWVGIGLGLCCWVLGRAQPRSLGEMGKLALVGALATVLALTCKEAALSIPALMVIAAARTRQGRFAWVALGSAIAGAVYVLLRAAVVLGAPMEATGYEWSITTVPRAFSAYHLYPFHIRLLEVHSLSAQRPAVIAVASVLFVLTYLVAFRGTRGFAWYLAASAAALGPVLILNTPANQYGYGLAALTAGFLAFGWQRNGVHARWMVLVVAMFWSIHGMRVAAEIYRVGSIQSRFSPAVAALVEASDAPVLLRPSCPQDNWVYRRLLHEIPAYNGVPINDRAKLATSGQQGAVRIGCDGQPEHGFE